MKNVFIAGLLSFLCVSAVFANENPRGLATDNRIKVVAYNANDVVTVRGTQLVSTAIYFDKSETVLHIDIGDQLAWKVSPSKDAPYVLFLSPQLNQSDTNMTVITNKRAYQFRLVTDGVSASLSKNITYALQFKYPEEEKEQLEGEINNLQKTFLGHTSNDAVQWNYDYSFYGSKKTAPIQAVDNGTFTIFKFPKHAIIPAIFAVDGHGNEAIVNFQTQGDYIFIQGVRHQYTLRNGEEVTTVYNDSYNIN